MERDADTAYLPYLNWVGGTYWSGSGTRLAQGWGGAEEGGDSEQLARSSVPR